MAEGPTGVAGVVAGEDFQTWSRIPVRQSYGPADVADLDHGRDIGEPGQYPFTRGIHEGGYRQRRWITRQLCGLDTPVATNRRLRFLLDQGQTGLALVPDTPTQLGLDSDHPMGQRSAGMQGVPIATLGDMDDLFADIPLEGVTASFSVPGTCVPVLLAQYVAMADRRGIPRDRLRGSFQNDPVQATHCGYDAGNPLDLGLKLCIDTIEFCARELPNFHSTTVNAYDLRESGLDAVQEMAITLAIAGAYLERAVARGLDVDDIGRRMLVISGCHIDFFEEVAKFRAARRIWARMMRERFGARRERTCALTIAVHTAGSSLVAPQPINNVIRGAYEALAAVLGGCQGLDISSFDEAVAIPSEESSVVALRTQQIIARETGVTNTVDPLGGSYFVEALTTELERRMLDLMAEIERQGGIIAAAERGWLRQTIDQAQFELRREIASGRRQIVGLNVYAIPPEQDTLLRIAKTHRRPSRQQVARVRRWKRQRDQRATAAALRALYAVAAARQENLIPSITRATTEGATLGEILGTIRLGYGYSYDPVGAVAPPFPIAP